MNRQELDLRRRYGISLDDFDYLFHQQHGTCAICRQPETAVIRGKVKNLHVDHDHETGQVRGLLCTSCNIVLGHLKEDPKLALAVQYYLKKHEYDIAFRVAA